MRTDASSRPATQGLQPTQPGGKAGTAGAARVPPQPPDMVLRRSGTDGTPRPRTQVPWSPLTSEGLDLAAARRQAEVARLAGEAQFLADQKRGLKQQVGEQALRLRDAQAALLQAEQDAEGPEHLRGRALSKLLAVASKAEPAAAKVPELQREVFRLEWQHNALAQELQSTTAQRREAKQRLATARRDMAGSQAMRPGTPATPPTPTQANAPGIAADALRTALETALQAGAARTAAQEVPAAQREQVPAAEAARTGSTPAALSALEQNQLRSALPHGGAAVTRLARRARLQEPHSRFDRLRAPLQRAPRPLEGPLLERFHGMVRDDIAAIARKNNLPAPQAAELMQRAVHTGALGASLPAQAREQLSRAVEDARAHLATTTPQAPTEDSAAPARPRPRPTAINKLDSGITVDLVDNPQASIATLTRDQVTGLLAALGQGAPDADELRFNAQKARAVDLLRCAINPLQDDLRARGDSLEKDLPPDVLARLKKAKDIAHVEIGVTRQFNPDRGAEPKYRLEFRFDGSRNSRDARQNAHTALGGVGPVYKATDTIAAIMADLLQQHGERYEISLVSGGSLGGGTAQAFLAGVESRTPLPTSPPLVLLDPQMLNDAQASAASRGGPHGYDFQKPRGVALSLDYARKPHKGLMDLMKGAGGYRHPGLMHIRLGLDQGDGARRSDTSERTPRTTGLLGYHGEHAQYSSAIRRFTREVGELSEAGKEALAAKYGGRSPPPRQTPASPREDSPLRSPHAGATSAVQAEPAPAALSGTELRPLPAQDRSAPAKARSKGVAINRLDSGVKADLSRRPDATLASLPPQDLDNLLRALQLGPPAGDARGLYEQKQKAKALLEDFCDKMPGLANAQPAFHGPSAGLLKLRMSDETYGKLQAAAKIAHCQVRVSRTQDAPYRMRLEMFFGALENLRDLGQAITTATGRRGPVYKATDEIAAILADQIRAMNGHVEIGFVGGASMGGGTAQAFLAGLESRVQLPASPPLILLDPQLLNNAQSRHATRDRPLDYDFEKPRGLAISLDYDKAPRRGLMGIMKGPGGYTYPGLMHLKLGLKDDDGPEGGKPLATPPGLGYHGVGEQFDAAIRRFTRELGERPRPALPPFLHERPGQEDGGSGGSSFGSASLRVWGSEDYATSSAASSMRSDRSGPSGL